MRSLSFGHEGIHQPDLHKTSPLTSSRFLSQLLLPLDSNTSGVGTSLFPLRRHVHLTVTEYRGILYEIYTLLKFLCCPNWRHGIFWECVTGSDLFQMKMRSVLKYRLSSCDSPHAAPDSSVLSNTEDIQKEDRFFCVHSMPFCRPVHTWSPVPWFKSLHTSSHESLGNVVLFCDRRSCWPHKNTYQNHNETSNFFILPLEIWPNGWKKNFKRCFLLGIRSICSVVLDDLNPQSIKNNRILLFSERMICRVWL